MSSNSRRPLPSAEWCLVILIPLVTVLSGALMIHVASNFGFTALGEPAVVEADVR